MNCTQCTNHNQLRIKFVQPKLKVRFGQSQLKVVLGTPVSRGHFDAPIYDGDYVVVPMAWEQQSLPTSMKLLTQDVTVLEIPYYETTNLSGGYTVNIG